MGLLSWIVFGFLAGAVAGRISGRRAGGCISKVVVGILGALIGGGLARAAGYGDITGFHVRSFIIAVLGAVLLLLLLSAVEGRSRRR